MPTTELDPAQQLRLRQLAAGWLGCAPDDLTLEPARGGRSTPVFRVTLDTTTCYLRLAESPSAGLGPEALAHEVLLSYGVRVPAVIGYEPCDPVLSRSVMLTTAIPGASLDDAPLPDPAPVLTTAGADLAHIGQVPVEGFGWIDRSDPLPTRLTAPHSTWDAFAAELTAVPLDAWFPPDTLTCISALARTAPADPQRAALAHGDFDPSHIFTLQGHYSGLIDFGEIRGAEPTFDLGHLALHAPDALPAILRGYVTITPLPPDHALQIAASALRIGWFRLTQSSARTNPPYAAQLVSAMTRLAHHPTP